MKILVKNFSIWTSTIQTTQSVIYSSNLQLSFDPIKIALCKLSISFVVKEKLKQQYTLSKDQLCLLEFIRVSLRVPCTII